MPTLFPTASYQYALPFPGGSWAWEYLRRHPDYQRDWRLETRAERREADRQADAADRRPPGERAARWGLRFLEPPDLNGVQTVPFWRADAVPPVRVGAGPRPGRRSRLFELWAEPGNKVVAVTPEGAYLVIEAGPRVFRLRFADPEDLRDRVPLEVRLSEAADDAEERAAAARFLDRARTAQAAGRFAPPNAQGLLEQLQALDGHLAGASVREIAEAVFGTAAVAEDWLRVRRRTAYRIDRGLWLMNGGYLTLLRNLRPRS